MTNVKFSLTVKHWLIQILLDDIGLPISILMFFLLLHNGFNLVKGLTDNNSISPITKLTWFNNPDIFALFDFLSVLFVGFILLIIIVQEFEVLRIFKPMLNVKSQWQKLKEILFCRLIVLFHG